MAHRKNLTVPLRGMPFVWNIDNKVGTQTSETNERDDVALIQLLLTLSVPRAKEVAPGCKQIPKVTGEMDVITGFWIYYYQVDGGAGTQVDGYLSPMRGQNLHPYMLARINYTAFTDDKAAWENLPNHMLCPPSLKAKLLAPPKSI